MCVFNQNNVCSRYLLKDTLEVEFDYPVKFNYFVDNDAVSVVIVVEQNKLNRREGILVTLELLHKRTLVVVQGYFALTGSQFQRSHNFSNFRNQNQSKPWVLRKSEIEINQNQVLFDFSKTQINNFL